VSGFSSRAVRGEKGLPEVVQHPRRTGLFIPWKSCWRWSRNWLSVIESRRRACRTYRPSLLKAFPAVNRAALRRFERNRGFFSALRANGLRFNALDNARTCFVALRPIPLAGLTALGFVFKALIDEEHLLARGENEFRTAVGALENLIVIFHTLLRDQVGEGSGRFKRAACGEGTPGLLRPFAACSHIY